MKVSSAKRARKAGLEPSFHLQGSGWCRLSKDAESLGKVISKVELRSRFALPFLHDNVPVNSPEMWTAVVLRCEWEADTVLGLL